MKILIISKGHISLVQNALNTKPIWWNEFVANQKCAVHGEGADIRAVTIKGKDVIRIEGCCFTLLHPVVRVIDINYSFTTLEQTVGTIKVVDISNIDVNSLTDIILGD